MVLRDSKQDKVTFETPVNNPINDTNIMNKNVQNPDTFSNCKKAQTIVQIDPGCIDLPMHRDELPVDVARASTSSESAHKIDSKTVSDRQTPEEDLLIESTDLNEIGEKKQSTESTDLNEIGVKKQSTEEDDLNEIGKKKHSFLRHPDEFENEVDSASSTSDRKSRSREVSPMQEKMLLEQNWQSTLAKIDVILSETSAFHKGHFNQQLFIKDFTDKYVLQLLFKLFDWDCKGRITQEKFVDCARRTLLLHGGIELVELLDVVAYVVCGGDERDITESLFIKIFTSKGVVLKLFHYLHKDGNGYVSRQEIMDLIANLTYARTRTGFSNDNLEWLEKLFRQALGEKQELCFEDFKKIVKSRNSFFAERVFEIFDRDKNGSVSLSEFLDAMHQFAGKSHNDKIQFLFRVYDVDGDGLIQREELEQVMKACMEENGMKFSHEQIEDLTLALFEDADTEQMGEITFEALKAQLEKHPGLLENLSISIDRWLVPPDQQVEKQSFIDKVKSLRPYQLTVPYWRNNYVYLIFLFSYISVNVGLFVDRAITVADNPIISNWYYVLARACGQCLNFNCAFIVVLTLRQCITFLRARGASSFLPLDQNLYFHKLVGWVTFFYSILHTAMHLVNIPKYLIVSKTFNPKNLTTFQYLFTADTGKFGLVPGWANPTGVVLVVVLIIMVICSLPFVRKSGYFEVFYWTHLLYISFWVLTILHGPTFWRWFIGPGVLFLFEKLYRVFRVKTGHGKTYISSGILLPSKVIHLVIQKPYNFHYCPGDYVFVNIPSIAKYEWHPLTISSAPEQDGAIWLHVRAVGEWTNRLYNYFENQQLQCEKRTSSKQSVVKIPIELEMGTKLAIEKGETRLSGGRKNGVINVSYENDDGEEVIMEKIAEETEEKVEVVNGKPNDASPTRFPRNKKLLKKTTSVPDLEVRMKKKQKKFMLNENYRTNSETAFDPKTLEAAGKIYEQETRMLSKTNRSVARSVRYMRRKPKVVTLDMPAEDSDTEETQEINELTPDSQENDMTMQIDSDVEAPKNTEVRRGSGRLSQIRKMSKNFSNKTQKTKSHRESQTQLARRISRMKEAETFGQCTLGKPLAIYIDGPYGAPSSHIFRAQHAILIATGIGVTPFASILQSIMHRYLKTRQMCPSCDHTWISDIPQSVMNLRKVDFFWINRNQRSFEWFVNLLSQLEIEQAEHGGVLERFLDMHMYITSALQKTDMKAVGLQLALELLHEKEKRDLITGLKTRTNAGRPNWDKVFKQLRNQKKGKITVFYCGPPALARILRYKCGEFGFEFRKENF